METDCCVHFYLPADVRVVDVFEQVSRNLMLLVQEKTTLICLQKIQVSQHLCLVVCSTLFLRNCAGSELQLFHFCKVKLQNHDQSKEW